MACNNNKYKELRESNIQRNHDFLKSLGIEKPPTEQKNPALIPSRKRSYSAVESPQPKRRSVRLVGSLSQHKEAPEVVKSARIISKDEEDHKRKRITPEVSLVYRVALLTDIA